MDGGVQVVHRHVCRGHYVKRGDVVALNIGLEAVEGRAASSVTCVKDGSGGGKDKGGVRLSTEPANDLFEVGAVLIGRNVDVADLVAEDLTPDMNHLSVAGHGKMAALEWKALSASGG